MAKSVLTLVCLLVASFCVANAGRVPSEPSRKLIAVHNVVGDVGEGVHVLEYMVFNLMVDMSGMPKTLVGGTMTLKVKEKALGVKIFRGAHALVAGKVNKLKCGKLRLQKRGVVHIELHIQDKNLAVALNLVKLKAVVVGKVEVTAYVVFVLDKRKKVLHLRNQHGECMVDEFIDINAGIGVGV